MGINLRYCSIILSANIGIRFKNRRKLKFTVDRQENSPAITVMVCGTAFAYSYVRTLLIKAALSSPSSLRSSLRTSSRQLCLDAARSVRRAQPSFAPPTASSQVEYGRYSPIDRFSFAYPQSEDSRVIQQDRLDPIENRHNGD